MPNPWEMGFEAEAPAPAAKPWEMGFSEDKPAMSTAYPGMKGRPFVVTEEGAQRGAEQAGLLKALGTGTVRGGEAIAGLPGDLQGIIDMIGEKAAAKLGQSPEAIAAAREKLQASPLTAPNTPDVIAAETKRTGGLHEASTPAEKLTEEAGTFLTGGLLGPGGAASKLGRFTALPMAASEAAGAATKGSDYEPWARALAATLAPAIAPRIATPIPARAGHVADVDRLRAEGVPTTAGDRTDSTPLRYWENDLEPGRKVAQEEGFTRAAGRRIGLDEPYLTQGQDGAFTQRFNQIRGDFDTLTGRNTAHADPQLLTDLQHAYNEVHATPGLYPQDVRDAVHGTIRRISDVLHTNGGVLPGGQYQTLRSEFNTAAMGAEGQRAHSLRGIVEALDDNMERSIQAAGGADAGAFPQTRRNYRNALVLEDALTSAGPAGARGTVTPAKLAAAAKRIYGRRTYSQGVDDFSALAEPGVSTLKTLPDSGTSQRNRINEFLRRLGGVAGMGIGLHAGGTEAGVAGLLAAENAAPMLEPVVRKGVRGALMNPLTQRYLGNQAAADAPGLFSTIPGNLLAVQGATRAAQGGGN